jgi:pilus assembly protein CpaF
MRGAGDNRERATTAESAAGYERMKARLKMRLADLLESGTNDHRTGAARKALEEQLSGVLKSIAEDYTPLTLTAEEERRMVGEVLTEVVGYGPLDELLADPSITEIMVNGPHEIFVERAGRLERVPAKFRDAQHLTMIIERMLGTVNLSVHESDPICDATLPDGARINVVIAPLVLGGPVVTIRTKSRTWTMDAYVESGALSAEAAAFLQACVKAKVNIVFSGGTSTGKTTLVSILSQMIPQGDRIITIENVAELELPEREHWIRLVARMPNLQGRGEIPLRVLVKNALRMRPDRIILGEARGGEALDVVQAMHTGHDGVMTVLHANTPRAALERLETLMLMSGLDLPPAACRAQIATAVDLIVHIGRFADGSRRVAAITQVLGASAEGFQLEDLFVFEAQGYSADNRLQGTCRYTGARPKFLEKFRLSNVDLPAWVAT